MTRDTDDLPVVAEPGDPRPLDVGDLAVFSDDGRRCDHCGSIDYPAHLSDDAPCGLTYYVADWSDWPVTLAANEHDGSETA